MKCLTAKQVKQEKEIVQSRRGKRTVVAHKGGDVGVTLWMMDGPGKIKIEKSLEKGLTNDAEEPLTESNTHINITKSYLKFFLTSSLA